MALVAYDNSDSSEYEDDGEEKLSVIVLDNKPNAQAVSEVLEVQPTEAGDKTNDGEKSLFTQLPQPSFSKNTVVEEDDEFLHKKASVPAAVKAKPKIMVPSLSDFKDVGDTAPAAKPRQPSGKKSGLLSILPQPRNGVTATTKSFLPNVLRDKPQTSIKKVPLPVPIKHQKSSLVTEYSDESDNDEVQNDFFSINKPAEILPDELPLDIDENSKTQTKSTNNTPRSLESYFKKDDLVDLQSHSIEESESYSEQIEESNEPESSSNEMVLDEEAILKLCGSRGKRKREEIQILDINQQEVLNDAREMLLKGLMDDTSKRQSASKKRGNEPTSQQRRKHQITYLAHQAKANEVELQNQWANNRMTKRKTQSKYGF